MTHHLAPPRTPYTLGVSFAGGLLIGAAAALFLLVSGQRAGLSGIFSGFSPATYKPWKTAFTAGFLLAVLVCSSAFPSSLAQAAGPQLDWASNVVGGFLVGFGTRLGNGCTSGHGVCGLARFSKRGLASVCTFMAVGFITSTAFSFTGAFRVNPSKWDEAWGGGAAPESSWWTWFVAATILLLLSFDVKGKAKEGWRLMLASAFCGAVFGIGLVVSKMAVRQKVLNFLWLSPSWDPSLAFVMGGAVLVNVFPTQYLMHKHNSVAVLHPTTKIWNGKTAWEISMAEVIDWKLISGAVVFGLGWGWAGLCPGPAVVLWAAGYPKVVLAFIPAMLLGMEAFALFQARFLEDPHPPSSSTLPLAGGPAAATHYKAVLAHSGSNTLTSMTDEATLAAAMPAEAQARM